jgi:hypothetical protein
LARFKNAFPLVHDMLVGADGNWLGLDDFQPFWAMRRISEAAELFVFVG